MSINIELVWTIHVVSKLNETQHSPWNNGPQFEDLMFTIVNYFSSTNYKQFDRIIMKTKLLKHDYLNFPIQTAYVRFCFSI